MFSFDGVAINGRELVHRAVGIVRVPVLGVSTPVISGRKLRQLRQLVEIVHFDVLVRALGAHGCVVGEHGHLGGLADVAGADRQGDLDLLGQRGLELCLLRHYH